MQADSGRRNLELCRRRKIATCKVDDPSELGNAWVFVAMDADTKLIPSYVSANVTAQPRTSF